MRILYLDDSGKSHPSHSSRFVAFAGFSVDETRWHDLIRQVSGAKGKFFPKRGKPADWELKTKDFLTPNAWNRANNRRFCFEILGILKKNDCRVYAVYFNKANAARPIAEDWIVPLSFQRLLEKFDCELRQHRTIGTIVCDWSTHKLDRHVCNCVQSHAISQGIRTVVGGITYGSSQSLTPIQLCDLIAGAFRISEEDVTRLAKFRHELSTLRSDSSEIKDCRGFSPSSISKLF